MTAPHPDLVVRRARRVPLTPVVGPPVGDADEPVDVLVSGGRIRAVVPSEAGLDLPGDAAETEELDAEGRWLLPGLWDAHTHLGQWTLAGQRLDLRGAATPEQVLERVAAAVAAAPGIPVVGQGHVAGAWHRPVTVSELDAVTGPTPVVLINSDFHHGWLNSAALAALHLAPRDEVVEENEWFAAYPYLDELVGTAGTSPAAYQAMLERAASLGVVGLVDFEFGAPYQAWARRWGHGCDLLRIRWATYADGLDAVIAEGLRTGDPLPGCDDTGAAGLATMGPLKIISDGSLGTRSAWCCEPYADTGEVGAPNQSGEELRELLARATAHGLEVAVHAIGDRAAAEALAAYAGTGARGSIEHAQLVRRADVTEMARLGVRASVQPAHLLDDRAITEWVWPDRTDRTFALRWMLEDGVDLALGSDAPVAPLDPWLAVSAAVHRGPDGGDPWHAEQALTVQEALAGSVDGQRIAPGARGDLILLDHDPLACPAPVLRSMPVSLTVVAGRVVHRVW